MTGASSGYQSPPWAQPPQQPSSNGADTDCWKLLEIKSGVQVAEHVLTDACTILGRAEDQVQIVLAHESCSRIHARIAFDHSGVAWLRDLGSTHGTIVNKRRLPSNACGLAESNSTHAGSRGVRVYPGDVLQFGASTRLYCVEGPEAHSRHRQKLQKDLSKSLAGSTTPPETIGPGSEVLPSKVQESSDNISKGKPSEGGISWGLYDDDDDDEPDQSVTEASAQGLDDLREDSIPPQHRSAWEKIQALQYKLNNLETESSRIRRKGEDSTLSQGQERQLQRNEERMTQLRQDIDERKLDLWRKLHPEPESGVSHRRESQYFVEDEEVEDRTRREEVITFDESGETKESLRQKHASLLERLTRLEASLTDANNKVQLIQGRVSQLRATGNEEEAFYAENDLALAKETMLNLTSEQSLVDAALRETNRLLKIVDPKWVSSSKMLTRNQGDTEEPTVELMPSPPPRIPQVLPNPLPNDPMPPPPPRGSLSTLREPPIDVSPSESRLAKRSRVIGPSARSTLPSAEDGKSAGPSEGRPKSLPSARSGVGATLAALVSSSVPQSQNNVSRSGHEKRPRDLDTKVADKIISNSNNQTNNVWKPPENQDGSGYTKLNAKFAGRY